MYKKMSKIIAGILVFMLAFSNLSIIGIYSQEIYAANEEISFDASFLNGSNHVSNATKELTKRDRLYIKMSVGGAGYLKQATIEAKGTRNNEANFAIVDADVIGANKNDYISNVEKNKVTLKKLEKGKVIEILLPFVFNKKQDVFCVEDFNQQNIIKLTSIYVDGNGKEKTIEKEVSLTLQWQLSNAQAQLEITDYKFLPLPNNNGVAVQVKINQSSTQGNLLPILKSELQVSVPLIGGIKPIQRKIQINSTEATNGEKENNNVNISQTEEYTKIEANNTINQNGEMNWKTSAKDEYIVTYIYSQEAIQVIKKQGFNFEINANTTLTVYTNNGETKLTARQAIGDSSAAIGEDINIETLKKGEFATFSINTDIEEKSKGQMYANIDASKKVETEYTEELVANIAFSDAINKITFEQLEDKFVSKDGNATTAGNNAIYFKTIAIEKKTFDKILGEKGNIKIYQDSTLIATIDNTIAEQNGKLIANIAQNNINKLRIETSNPIKEGSISLEVTKAIKADAPYTKAQLNNFAKLDIQVTGKAQGATLLENQNLAKSISLVEPSSKAEVTINNNNLSTVVTNENVKITAILRTDDISYKLYKNPTLEITLPSYIENINVKNVEVLFETEGSKLTLKGHQVVQNADGTKTILVNLEGTQTEYTIGAMSKGLNVVITSDITLNKLTPNKKDNIVMKYTNNNIIGNNGVETKTTSTLITIVAPTGVITTTSISNYAEGAQTITSISGEEKVATIATMVGARNVTLAMNVINNYNNTIDNISILGRTMFKGNKDIVNGKDLSSTMNIPLTSAITVANVDASKVKVYYSENGEATKDLNNTANGWTLSPANLANVKSYLIVLTDHTMNTGNNISFTYNAQIPANLQHNEEAYETYVAYFNNNLETGKVEDKVISTKLGVTTGLGPVLEASIKSNIPDNEGILEGKLIKYTITISNKGRGEAQNVVATYEVPNCLTQVILDETSSLGYKLANNTENKIQIENIPVNGTTTKDVWFKVKGLTVNDICKDETHYTESEIAGKIHNSEYTHSYEDYKCQINLSVTITADRQLQEVTAKSNNNIAVKSFYITQGMCRLEGIDYAKEGENIRYFVNITSSDTEERKNTIVKVKIPEELTYKEAKATKFVIREGDVEIEAKTNYNEKTRELTIEIGNVDGYYGKRVEIIAEVNKLNIQEYEKEIALQANIQGDNTPLETTEKTTIKLARYALNINQVASITENSSISAAEDFKYTITIENPSPIQITGVKVKDYLPAELEYAYSIITSSTGFEKTVYTVDENGNPEMRVDVEGKSTVKIEVYVIAKEVEQDTKITNNVTIEQVQLGKIQANAISHKIEKFDGIIEEPEKAKKRIVGTVWKDDNKNGILDTEEAKMPNVEVMLFNNSTSNLVVDEEGKVLIVKTSEDGTYTFDNISQGNYTIIFLYDTANYSATKYKVEGANEEVNSNAVDTKITIDGKIKVAAITEEIRVKDSNVYNINLGLIENAKFDLKLDKTVSKITVKDSKGTNVYDYENTKLAKKDLIGKEVNNTTIIVEYKMIVTNEGAIPGYVKKIVDYIPSEMKFSSELNRDWYVAENGAIYNSSLANTLINPGESKVVTLLLTKKMTEENLGLYHNTAEIYEAYNDLGIEDVDSTEGNKASNEDDISFADVLITVKTGEAILFVGLTITIITIIGIGAYFIKKKVLR